ncbi:MAG: hypothetical protein JXB30_02580 [Anaerolineae bacterium]|nr:hypothetical protein [Anaerolineae bacterium]
MSAKERESAKFMMERVEAGETAIATVPHTRPCDVPILCGVYYAGEWYPPSDPRGAELEKLRYMLPAPKAQNLGEWQAVADGYDETCGMQPLDEWRRDFLHVMYEQLAVWFRENTPHDDIRDGFRWAAEAYLLSSKTEEAKPTPIAPQDLQSNEEILEQIAMSRAPIEPNRLDELLEAVQVAISEWTTNPDARNLPDGYCLYSKPDEAAVPTWIYLKHPTHPNRIVMGEMSIRSDKDTHSELQFVSCRGEIRAYMLKVKDGMKPSTNPKLAGVLMQAPIGEPVMSPQIQTLKNLTESQRAFAEVLSMPFPADTGR